MKQLLHILCILGTTALLVGLTTPAHAVSDQVRCDTTKGETIGKLFAKVVKCHTKNFANTDPSFDVMDCIATAYATCVAKFDKTDAKFGSACITPGNGTPLCDDVADQARR